MSANGMYEFEFEEAFIDKLREEGWTYTHGDNLPNRHLDEGLIEEDVKSFIRKRYADRELTDDEIAGIVGRLRNVSGASDYEALFNAVALYRDGFDFQYSDGRKSAFHFDFIDFDDPDNNIFRVVNQFTMIQGNENRRPDVMLFVNGIPVCIIELKNPTDPDVTIRDAHTQITVRYRRDIMNLLKYSMLAVVSDGSNSRLGSVFSDFEYFYAWKKVNNEDDPGSGIDELDSLIKGALAPARMLELIRDYVYFPDRDYALKKELEIVCRYPQFFATRRLRDNILHHLRSAGGDGKGGTYFGATGCGKTYTMLFLARQLALRCTDKIGKPTVLIIVDREDLETQTEKLFANSIGFLSNGKVKKFENRDELGQELSHNTQGGVFVTTIQKFTSATGLLSDRSNIICISDEAHRTQNNTGSKLKVVDRSKSEERSMMQDNTKLGAFITYGFAKYLRDALPNATYVGFTGTPIDETIHVFGGIVDTYSMRQARADNITVDIAYDPRLIHVNLDKAQCDLIESYYKKCEEEGAKSEDVDTSKGTMSSLNEILSNPDRLDRMARDIIGYYDQKVADQPELLQKAMIVCSDRTITFNLYNTILRYRPEWGESVKTLHPEDYTEDQLDKMEAVPFVNVVATRDKDDPKDMYDLLGDKQHRKDLDRLFKDESSNFHIVIVVDMWITGFDVPCLTMLFNDKPLQKHTLIQTISRVNRKFSNVVLDEDGNRISGDVKHSGVIVDYLGIHENLQQALKKYGGDGDAGNVGDVNLSLEVFRNELKILKQITHGFDFSAFFGDNALARLQCLQGAVEFMLMQEAKGVMFEDSLKITTAFKAHVKRLKAAYNICNPAGVLTDDEVAWAQLFMGVCSYLQKITDSHHDVESMNRHVAKMVEEAISCSGVETIFEMKGQIDIYSDDFLKELDDIKLPCSKFELLVKLLRRAIKEYKKTNKTRAEHFYKLLEATVEEYHNRDTLNYVNQVAGQTVSSTVDVVEGKISALTDKLRDLFTQLQTDKLKFKELGLTFEETAFYDILIEVRDNAEPPFEYPDEKCKVLAKKIRELIDDTNVFADWLNNSKIRSKLAVELIKLLNANGYPPMWSNDIFTKVLDQVENFKTNE